MKLVELDPQWVREHGDGARIGIAFDCPLCRGSVVNDFKCSVRIPFSAPIEADQPVSESTRAHWLSKGWRREGDTFETLTLAPSIYVRSGGCKPNGEGWHGYVTNGEVSTC